MLTSWLFSNAPYPRFAEAIYGSVGAVFFIVLVVPAGLALQRVGSPSAILVGAWIAVLEWARCRVPDFPLPYHQSAHALASNPWIVQWAAPVGVCGLTALVATLSALAASVPGSRRKATLAGVLGMGLAITLTCGFLHYSWWSCHTGPAIDVVCISAPTESRPEQAAKYKAALRAAVEERTAKFIVLPETAAIERDSPTADYSRYLTIDEVVAAARTAGPDMHVISGLLLSVPGDMFKYRDAIAVFDPQGGYVARDKTWYSPVGERRSFVGWPMLEWIGPFLTESPMTPAPTSLAGGLSAGQYRLAVCICLDGMMPDLWGWRGSDPPPDLQVSIANLNTLHGSKLQRLQSRPSRILHAVAQRTPFLYVTTHYSEWIDAAGVVHTPGPAEHGVWRTTVQLKREISEGSAPADR